MNVNGQTKNGFRQLVVVRQDATGQFTAEALGLPEVRATDSDRTNAISRVRAELRDLVNLGRLTQVELSLESPLPDGCAIDPNDACEEEYRRILEKFKKADLDQTLREYELEDGQCSSSCSIPTI